MHPRIMFLRDGRGQPCGCLAINLDIENNNLSYQLSVLNPVDRFDRKMARHLALGRLMERPVTLRIRSDKKLTMHHISLAVMHDVATSKAPGRAVKAALNWINQNFTPERFPTSDES